MRAVLQRVCLVSYSGLASRQLRWNSDWCSCVYDRSYSGMVDCFIKSSQKEGPMSLYNGFWPNFGRVVPRVTIVFVVMEQLKKNFG